MGFIVRMVRLAWKWGWWLFWLLLPIVWWIVRTAISLMILSWAAVYVSPGIAIRRISNEWVKVWIERGFPKEWEHLIRPVITLLALLAVLTGWVISLALLFTIVFRFLFG